MRASSPFGVYSTVLPAGRATVVPPITTCLGVGSGAGRLDDPARGREPSGVSRRFERIFGSNAGVRTISGRSQAPCRCASAWTRASTASLKRCRPRQKSMTCFRERSINPANTVAGLMHSWAGSTRSIRSRIHRRRNRRRALGVLGRGQSAGAAGSRPRGLGLRSHEEREFRGLAGGSKSIGEIFSLR